MRFKFGTYSIKIQSYTSKELGIENDYPNLDFTVRQKVFHFWYIPIFPVDKFWKIKRADTGEEVLETTAKMRNVIDLKLLKAKSPLRSYSGVMVAAIPIVALLSYFLYIAVGDAIDGASKEIAKGNRIDLKGELVSTPQIEDLYTFKTLNVEIVTDMNGHFVTYKPSYFSSPNNVDFMVNYISKDSIGFKFVKGKKHGDYTFGLKEEFRLSKKDVISATRGYRDLDTNTYPNKVDGKTKRVVGIFEIKRE